MEKALPGHGIHRQGSLRGLGEASRPRSLCRQEALDDVFVIDVVASSFSMIIMPAPAVGQVLSALIAGVVAVPVAVALAIIAVISLLAVFVVVTIAIVIVLVPSISRTKGRRQWRKGTSRYAGVERVLGREQAGELFLAGAAAFGVLQM